MKYITKVLLGLDQFANTIIGGAPDETISARAGRLRNQPGLVSRLWWTPLSKILDRIQPNHVELAIEHEEDGSQQDPEYTHKIELFESDLVDSRVMAASVESPTGPTGPLAPISAHVATNSVIVTCAR